MDTLINISSAGNRSNILRSVLILAGIMIAIICSLISLKTLDSREAAEARTWGSMETPAIVTANFVMKASAAMGHSVMVLTKE